jgi:hypothetical protein
MMLSNVEYPYVDPECMEYAKGLRKELEALLFIERRVLDRAEGLFQHLGFQSERLLLARQDLKNAEKWVGYQ